MAVTTTAAPFVPDSADLTVLAAAASSCRGCELWEPATRTVFGEGAAAARFLVVGEQPGDQEDRQGEPFVGPAGRILAQALAAAGLDRGEIYLTNAVKHFRFKATASGHRRIHEKPAAGHVRACQPWLGAELTAVAPDAVIALGATAAGSLFGPTFRLTAQRGQILSWPPPAGAFADSALPVRFALATIHPSAVLRAGDDRDQALAGLIADLTVAARA